MISPAIKASISVAITTAGGALLVFFSAHPIPADGSADWRGIGIGAAIAVFSALSHLWQTPPNKVEAPPTTLASKPPVISPGKDAGFTRVGAMVAIVVVAMSAGVIALMACTPAQTAATKDATKCILTTAGDDETHGITDWQTLLVDVEAKCLVSEVDAVATLFAAKRASAIRMPADAGSPALAPATNPGF